MSNLTKQKTIKDLLENEPDVLEKFPDPSDIPIVDCIPKEEQYCIQVEDTFWAKKKRLIPDYSVMEAIDSHALKVN